MSIFDTVKKRLGIQNPQQDLLNADARARLANPQTPAAKRIAPVQKVPLTTKPATAAPTLTRFEAPQLTQRSSPTAQANPFDPEQQGRAIFQSAYVRPKSEEPEEKAKAGFMTLFNLPASAFGHFIAAPIGGVTSTVQEAFFNKQDPEGIKFKIPLLGGAEGVSVEGAQSIYNAAIQSGLSANQAFLNSAIQLGVDLSVAVPIAHNLSKFAVLQYSPESLLNSVELSRSQVGDILAGRDVSPDIYKAFSELPPPQKVLAAKGLLAKVPKSEPSFLGKVFGLDEKQAKVLFDEAIAKRTAAPEGTLQLPGYRPVPDTGVRIPGTNKKFNLGLAIEETERVGGAPKPSISKELEPLAAEARKYKSAEEFSYSFGSRENLSKQPKNIFYHGSTPEGALDIERSGFKVTESGRNNSSGISFTANPLEAELQYNDKGKNKALFRVQIKDNSKIVDYTEFNKEVESYLNKKGITDTKQYTDPDMGGDKKIKAEAYKNAVQQLIKKGVDAIDFAGWYDTYSRELRVINPNVIISSKNIKSLTDFYNQVNGPKPQKNPNFEQRTTEARDRLKTPESEDRLSPDKINEQIQISNLRPQQPKIPLKQEVEENAKQVVSSMLRDLDQLVDSKLVSPTRREKLKILKEKLELGDPKVIKQVQNKLEMAKQSIIYTDKGLDKAIGVKPGEAYEKVIKEIEPGDADVIAEGIRNAQQKETYNMAKKEAIKETGPYPSGGGLIQTLRASLKPVRTLDIETQQIYRNWSRRRLVTQHTADLEIEKLESPNEQGLDIILKYERGTPTIYTDSIKELFDSIREEAVSKGLDVKYIKHYLPHVYANSREEILAAMIEHMKKEGVSEDIISEYKSTNNLPSDVVRRLKLNPSFTKERYLPTYKLAMELGLTPKYTNPGQLGAYYRSQLENALANRNFVNELLTHHKLKTVETAPDGWKSVELPFSPKGYYASPELANLISGMFRDENNLKFGQKLVKLGAGISRTAQEIALSAGLPKTQINFFAMGQLIKEMTAGNFKAWSPFLRSNFDKRSITFFQDKRPVMSAMAANGINLGGHIATFQKIYGNTAEKKFWASVFEKPTDITGNAKVLGRRSREIFNKWFNEKTFASFMPQLYIQTFESAIEKMTAKGLSEAQAETFAAEVVKKAFGLMEDVGRSPTTEDTLSTIFFAPKFREGIINTLINTVKAGSTEFNNPVYYKNRRLIVGMVLSYLLYNALNKYFNDKYMFQNEAGKEFDLKIPLPDGQYVYLGFMPSFLTLARNFASAGIAAVRGDTKTFRQKSGSLLSMPLQTASEIWSNRDYFGREIYSEDDSGLEKAKKAAIYVGLDINHPFIKEAVKQLITQKDKPLYQSISEALEFPLKFNSLKKIEKAEYYDAMHALDLKRKEEKAGFMDTYTKIRELAESGKEDEARQLLDGLSDEEYNLYKDIRSAEKSKATKSAKAEFYPTYKKIRDLVARGQDSEAQSLLDGLTDQEYKFYQQLKADE